jgi:hypothetical protein
LSQPTSAPKILLQHDGELADIAALLAELGASIAERLGAPAAEDGETSWRLVVASARRALELPSNLLRASTFRVAVLEGESRIVRSQLRRASFELVVRRPVHPTALRLLLLHALYRGPEKRRTPRVSVGAPVHFRAGLRRHRAILAEISQRGCRLLSSRRTRVGQTLTLQIPAALAGGRAFSLKGLVVRALPPQIGAPGVLTLDFEPVRPALRARLRDLVVAHSTGPSSLARDEAPGGVPAAPKPLAEPIANVPEPVASAPAADPAPVAAPAADAALAEVPAPASPSTAAPRRLVHLSDAASRVVLAHSLSRAGMRADPSPRLVQGRELCLALHLESDAAPLRVRAHVEPGEGESGPWLRFKDLAPAEGERLDRLLTGLWALSTEGGPEQALVVCEILDPFPG